MKPRLKRLSRQVIVITGASSGIGLATAYAAAKKGARVVLAARNEAALRNAVNSIHHDGGRAIYVVADVTNNDDLENIVHAAQREFGGFDTWVNDAGLGIFGRINDVTEQDAHRLFDVNFWGMVNGTKIAAAHLQKKGGAIINLGSVVADVAFPIQGMYSASKHAIKGFTDAFRMEMIEARAPISVTLIKPSAINTPFAVHSKNYLSQEPKLPPPLYSPDDVAAAILHAAVHGGRDYYIGGGGKMMSSLNKHFPSLIDWVAARTTRSLSSFDTPPSRPREGNLFQAGADGGVYGNTPHHMMRSSYTKVTLHPLATAALIGAGMLLAGVLGAKQLTDSDQS